MQFNSAQEQLLGCFLFSLDKDKPTYVELLDMVEDIRFSGTTMRLLAALLESPRGWQYGYDLSRRTGLKSGTLYPILMRLTERDWLEAKWEFDDESGRPRHVYRLTAEGLGRARAMERKRDASIPRFAPQPAR